MKQNVEEIRERCKTKTENESRKEVCEEVDHGEHEKSEEQRKQEEEEKLGERKTLRKHDL